ncbi:MAG: hypothetical protein WC501_01600 [Candidatus Micrarchaeia archaeon]
MKKRKGQVATEFFAYSAIFLLLVMIVIVSVFASQDSENAYYENQNVIEIGNRFSSAFNLASSAGKGFKYEFEFPKYVYGIEYNISFVEGKYASIEWESKVLPMIYIYPINKFNMENSESAGNCIEKNGNVYIIKSTTGENKISFFNNGNEIIIMQGGCQ